MNFAAVQPLVVILEEELAIQNEVKQVLGDQRTHLQNADDDGFEGDLTHISTLLERATIAHRRRVDVLRSLGYGESVATPVANVAKRLPDGPRQRLETLRNDLVGIAGEVRRMSQFNAGLVRRSSAVNEDLLGVLLGPTRKEGGALVDSRA